MSTATLLHSIRRLLAFACLLLSLAVAGIGEIARAVDYGSDGGLFLAVGLLGALASTLWFLFALFTPASTEDATGTGGDVDAGGTDGTHGTDGENEAHDDEDERENEPEDNLHVGRGPY